jgi:hypothetical protein
MRNDIRRESARLAEASVYSMNNNYLDPQEKTEVELWFQLPIHLARLAFLTCAVYSIYRPLPWFILVGVPIGVDLFAGAILWAVYHPKVVFAFYIVFAHNWTLWILTLVAAVWLALSHNYLLAAFVFLAKLVFSVVFGWHMLLYSMLSHRYAMHPKYVFFKKFYGRTFPFEPEA